MGEIKIKSGNLVQSVTSYPATSIYIGSLYVEADLKPDTQYTFAFKLTEGYEVNWNSNLFTSASPIIVGKGDETIIVTKTTKSVVSKDNINQYNSNYGGWSITKNNKTEKTTGVYTEVQLLEGTYTSETIPKYQPYFINRPAHQVTNGQWVDIPTHHYTNGRWQGELTSQSPLKFRADGEMLDWRIEGRTSENLIESFRTTTYTEQYRICLLGMLNIKPSTSYTISFIMEEGAKAYFNENLFIFNNFTGTGQRQVINVTTKADIDKNVSTWTTEYGWILCKNMFNNENPCNFREVMILKGTYTSSTIPSYEPYGGVGDWDETAQRYKIPVKIDGENLFDGELEQGSLNSNDGSEVVNNTRVRTMENTLLKEGTYTINCVGATGGVVICAYNTDDLSYDKNASYVGQWRALPFTFIVNDKKLFRFAFKKADDSAISPSEVTNIKLLEGTYTTSTIPPYEVNLYTDHQLLDGDSIDYATTETQIPIATGNNVLTVDTAVQPSKVFIKFEG